MVEPVTTVKLDTPAGLVTAWVQCENHCVKSVTFQNVPSFLYGAKTVQVPEFGEVYAEVAFGGMAYAIVDAAQLGVQIRPDQAAELRRVSHILSRPLQSRSASDILRSHSSTGSTASCFTTSRRRRMQTARRSSC